MVIGSTSLLIKVIFLVVFFRVHIEQHFDDLLFDHIEELVAESNFTIDGKLKLEWRPLDPRFHLPGSGWYWEISQAGNVLAHSQSLVNKKLDIVLKKKAKKLRGIKKKDLCCLN